MSVPSASYPPGILIEAYLIKVDHVPRNKTDHIHFGQDTTVTQDCTFLCQRPLELLDNIPSLIVLRKPNYCIEQEQAGNDSQIDPVLQTGSQYKRQLQVKSARNGLVSTGMSLDRNRLEVYEPRLTSMTHWIGPTKNMRNVLIWLRFSSFITFHPYFFLLEINSASSKPRLGDVSSRILGTGLASPTVGILSSMESSSSSSDSSEASSASKSSTASVFEGIASSSSGESWARAS